MPKQNDRKGLKVAIIVGVIVVLGIVFLSVKFFKGNKYKWSSVEEGRVEIISSIENQKYNEVEKAVDKLISDFAGNQGLSEALYGIAEEYRWAGKSEEASAIYKKVVQNFPQSWHAARAEIGIPRENVTHLIALGDYPSAQKAIDKMISDFAEHPDLADALYWVADKYRWSGRHEEAKALYQRIVQDYPNSGVASKAKFGIPREEITSLIGSGDYSGAQKAIDRMAADFADDPDLADTLYQIAETYRWSIRHDEAKDLYQRIVRDYPNSAVASKAKFGIPREEITSLIESGNQAGVQNAIDKMAADFAKDPDLPGTLYGIAETYKWSLERYDDAINLYQRIIRDYPNSPYANKAKLSIPEKEIMSLALSGDYAGAKKALDKMFSNFAKDPNLPEILYEMARRATDELYIKGADEKGWVGRYNLAKTIYTKLIKDYPDSTYSNKSKLRFATVDAISSITSGDYTGTPKVLDKIISDFAGDPDLVQTIIEIGDACLKKSNLLYDKGDTEDAKQYLRNTIAILERVPMEFPGSKEVPLTYYGIGLCYGEGLGEYQKGIDYLQKILDSWPNFERNGEANFYIAEYYEVLMNSGAIPESVAFTKMEQYYRTVVEKYPTYQFAGDALLKLGQISFQQGKFPEAVKYFEMLIEKEPKEICRAGIQLSSAYKITGNDDMASHIKNEIEKKCSMEFSSQKKTATSEELTHVMETVAQELNLVVREATTQENLAKGIFDSLQNSEHNTGIAIFPSLFPSIPWKNQPEFSKVLNQIEGKWLSFPVDDYYDEVGIFLLLGNIVVGRFDKANALFTEMKANLIGKSIDPYFSSNSIIEVINEISFCQKPFNPRKDLSLLYATKMVMIAYRYQKNDDKFREVVNLLINNYKGTKGAELLSTIYGAELKYGSKESIPEKERKRLNDNAKVAIREMIKMCEEENK